jgi:hypothetical protein
MSIRTFFIPAIMLLAGFPTIGQAQTAPLPDVTVTYRVEVEWVNWHSGSSNWVSVIETQNFDDAEWTFNAIRIALDTGNIEVLFPSTYYTFVRDVRLVRKVQPAYDSYYNLHSYLRSP